MTLKVSVKEIRQMLSLHATFALFMGTRINRGKGYFITVVAVLARSACQNSHN
jgi:hypothetical protein